jgi:hypothetical protein
VDRDSLAAVLHDRRSGVYRYDVLPDRVVLRLWPASDSAPFSFNLHARFAMEAKSEPSSFIRLLQSSGIHRSRPEDVSDPLMSSSYTGQ